MNILYFLFACSPVCLKYYTILYHNNANLDFYDHNTTLQFNYYKIILEERRERETRFKRFWV
jgi:hypothetical protein